MASAIANALMGPMMRARHRGVTRLGQGRVTRKVPGEGVEDGHGRRDGHGLQGLQGSQGSHGCPSVSSLEDIERVSA